MSFLIDAVLSEFAYMTWQNWITVLVGACGLAWFVSWIIRQEK